MKSENSNHDSMMTTFTHSAAAGALILLSFCGFAIMRTPPTLKGDLPLIGPPRPEVIEEVPPSVIIERVRVREGLPVGLIEGIIQHETAGRWNEKQMVKEPKLCVRRKKCAVERYAHGLMGVVPLFHPECDRAALLTVEGNIECGGAFLGRLLRETGDVKRATIRYNGATAYAPVVFKKARLFKFRG